MQFQNIQIWPLIYFKSLYQLHLIAYCVKQANLHFSVKDGLLGKIFGYYPQKVKIEDSS